jgi:hypothetical protein
MISNLNMSLNAMTHLNLLEDVTPPIQPLPEASKIPGLPTFIHHVEVQYVDVEDVDPFQDM